MTLEKNWRKMYHNFITWNIMFIYQNMLHEKLL
jgi:hypothetical protein